MTKEEKLVVINAIAEQLQAYPHFYIADIEGKESNEQNTHQMRKNNYVKEGQKSDTQEKIKRTMI